MKRMAMSLVIAIGLLVNTTICAQTSSEASANVNGQSSVQADKTNTQVSGAASSSAAVSAELKEANAGLATGTAFNATLITSVDSRKAEPGDEITARTVEAVRAERKMVLPKGTKLIGHITQASARAKGDSESVLGITFDQGVLKNGMEIPLSLSIQALASAQTAAAAAGNDMDTMADMGSGAGASGAAHSRGTLGGATSAVGGAVGGATNTAANLGGRAGGELNSTLNSAAGSSETLGGLNASGQLTSNSRGVFNLNGLSLSSGLSSDTQASVVVSSGKNVHLDAGTRMLLVTQAATSAKSN